MFVFYKYCVDNRLITTILVPGSFYVPKQKNLLLLNKIGNVEEMSLILFLTNASGSPTKDETFRGSKNSLSIKIQKLNLGLCTENCNKKRKDYCCREI